jgi:phage terminase large subunit-like protein
MAMPQEEFDALPLREQFKLLAPFAESDPEAAAWVEETERLLAENPLLAFEPHPVGADGRRPQLEFIEARTPVVAAFAGTRFGKSTVLGVCGLREALPRGVLPELLAGSKRFAAPTKGWIMLPTLAKIEDSFRPVFEKWTPPSEFHGGSWDKAFNGATYTLRFKRGSTIAFKTYEQPSSTLGGAALHWIGYDEPPPKKHREEGMFRLVDYGGFEMFAMTPLDTNTGYVRREIYKKRESPDITVVSGSIHENPHLDAATRERALGVVSDIYRAAREFGIFVDVGGLIYPEFERCVVREPWSAEFVRSLYVVVGIDPGIRNAGITWTGFDRDNVAYVFAEELLQDSTPADYAAAIRAKNARWGLKKVLYVVDPAARSRGQTNAETVQQALLQNGIPALAGQNDVQTGISQLRTRMDHGRFWVSPECRGLRDEADDYAGEEPAEGKDDSHLTPVKSNDHRLDSLRYACMERFWDPMYEMGKPQQMLGWDPASGTAPPTSLVTGRRRVEYGPLGSFS